MNKFNSHVTLNPGIKLDTHKWYHPYYCTRPPSCTLHGFNEIKTLFFLNRKSSNEASSGCYHGTLLDDAIEQQRLGPFLFNFTNCFRPHLNFFILQKHYWRETSKYSLSSTAQLYAVTINEESQVPEPSETREISLTLKQHPVAATFGIFDE